MSWNWIPFRSLLAPKSSRKSRLHSGPRLEQFEQRLALTITAPVIVDNGDPTYAQIAASSYTDITNLAGSEVTPNAVSDAAGNLHMVYSAGADGAYHLMYRTRAAGSSTWAAATDLGGTNALTPRIDIDAAGNLYAVYSDGNEIFYRTKPAAGAWAAALQLSVAANDSIAPDVSVDGTGRVHVVWQDKSTGNFDIRSRINTAGVWAAEDTVSTRADDDVAPRVDTDSAGNAHIVWHNTVSNEVSYRKHNVGGTYNAIERVDTSTERSFNPDVLVDSAGTVHVAWHDNLGTNWDAAYASRPAAGAFSAPTYFANAGTEGFVNLDQAPDGKLHLTWMNYNNLYRVENAGAGWSAITLVLYDVGAREHTAVVDKATGKLNIITQAQKSGITSGASWDLLWYDGTGAPAGIPAAVTNIDTAANDQQQPDVITDSAGNLYAVYQSGAAGAQHVFFRTKAVASSTWSASTDLGGTNAQRPRIALDSATGEIHLVYFDTVTKEVHYRKRSNVGVWGAATQLSATPTLRSYEADIAVAAGVVHVVWHDDVSGNWEIRYRRFQSGAWQAEENISTNLGDDVFPRIAAASDGQVHVIWHNWDTNEIYFRHRSAAGVWDAAITRLDTTADTSHYADIAVDSAGNAHAVWQEGAGGNINITYMKRTAAGVWGSATSFANPPVTDQFANITVGGDDKVRISWADADDVLMVDSQAFGGGGWSAVQTIMDNIGGLNSAVVVEPTTNRVHALAQATKAGVTNGWDMYWYAAGVAAPPVVTWTNQAVGYLADSAYATAGIGANVAQWTFTGLQDGVYTIEATWVVNAANATNANYKLTVGGASSDVVVNQTVAPLGTTAGGSVFQPIGTITVTGGSVMVQLSDRANGRVVADAVRIVPPASGITAYGAGSRAVYSDVASDAAGNLYAVYSGGTDSNLHTRFVTKAAGSTTWSAPVDLGGSNTGVPRITVAANGDVHVVWHDVNNVYYRKRTGAVWGATTLISDGTKSLEPDVGVDASNNVSVVWHCNGDGDYDIYYRRFDAASSTWLAQTKLSTNTDLDGFPRLAVGTDSTVHVTWHVDRAGNANDDIQYMKYTAGVWSGITRIDTGSNRSFNAAIALNASNQPTIVWHEDLAADWNVAVSRFNGAAWSAPTYFNATGTEGMANVAISPSGVVAIVWMDYNDYYMVRNDQPGGAWSPIRKVIETDGADNSAGLAVDPSTGEFHVVAQTKATGGSWNISYYRE